MYLNKSIYNKINIISTIALFVIIIELLYIGYKLTFKSKYSVYFEGINAVEATEKDYVAVGSNNNNDKHYERASISKYNLKKEKTFEKLYNVGFNSVFFGVVNDSSDIVAVGSYEKTSKDHKESVRRALIVKYDSEGNVIFEKDFKLLNNSKFTSVIMDGEDYLVTGQSIYKNTDVGNGEGGAILAKYSKDGKLLWSKVYGSNKEAVFNDLVIVDNHIYVVGTDKNHLGVIVEYDRDGNYITFNDYKTTDSIGFSGITAVDDYIYVSGAGKTGDTDTDAMIVQYDLDCTYIDQVIYKGEGIERFNKLIVDDHDNLIAIGTQAKAKKNKKDEVADYNYDGVIAKYDLDLNKIDAVLYGDERDDYFTDIKFIDGKYLVVGYSSYEDGSYMSKFINYSKALKVLEVE